MNNIPGNRGDVRWGDWSTAFLLVISMQVAAARLAATLWTIDLFLVQVVTFIGTLLGLTLGKSRFRRVWVVLLAFGYGAILIPWQLGLTLDPDIKWLERLINLWGRLQHVIQELLTRKPITDNLLFLFLMALLFWSLAIYTGFVLVREGNPWKVVLPGGIAAFVIHSFDPLLVSRSWFLAFYLFFALLLVARMVYIKNTAKWKERHTHTPPDIGFDFSRVALVLSMILVFFAWNVPMLADTFEPAAQIWQTASKPWLTVKDRFSFMFESLRSTVSLVQNFYGDTLSLGMGSQLSDQVVMEVQAPTNPPNGIRYYWEARTYGTYETNQWFSNLRTAHALTADSADIKQPGAGVRAEITFTFFPHAAISNLYAVPEPLWISLPTQAYMVLNPDGLINFGALISKNYIRPGERYVVRSAVDALTIMELKDAGTLYPDWVTDEYLQLPENITSRTKELAENIASGVNNPYDIVLAVTEYLRNNIEYTQSISQPPSNQERVDWFLFDYEKGFCNYYASAEVILLRSLGIPARLAVGFAQGERVETPTQQQPQPGGSQNITNEQQIETSTYIVRQKDAHAWPEIYFPGLGWVIFEPTVSQQPLVRLSGETTVNPLQDQTDRQEDEIDPLGLRNRDFPRPDENISSPDSTQVDSFWTAINILKLIILIFALTLLLIVILHIRYGFKVQTYVKKISLQVPERVEKGLRQLGIHPPDFLVNWVYVIKLPQISRSYMEINHALARIGKKAAAQDTPSDRTASLISAIPEATTPAERLLFEYQTSFYSPRQPNEVIAQKAGNEIRKLSWLARLRKYLHRFRE
jgi:transglutaminase-like putative cysteine protease